MSLSCPKAREREGVPQAEAYLPAEAYALAKTCRLASERSRQRLGRHDSSLSALDRPAPAGTFAERRLNAPFRARYDRIGARHARFVRAVPVSAFCLFFLLTVVWTLELLSV
jgi:hypothetical protein